MKLIADLIKEFPAARKYRADLEALAAENAELRRHPSHFLEKWETLDGPAVATLIELAQREHGTPAELAASGRIHIQLVESYLKYMATRDFVHPHPAGNERYLIGAKGQRYLHERGMLQVKRAAGGAKPAKAKAKPPAKKAPARKAARRKRG